MKTSFSKALCLVAAFLFLSASTLVAATFQRYVVAGTQIYLLEDDGSLTLAGDVTVDGATTLTGAVTITGALGVTGAATIGGATTLDSQTIAQLDADTPSAVGEMFLCSDCVQSTVCISSGTGTGAYVVLVATGNFTGATFSGLPHCQ